MLVKQRGVRKMIQEQVLKSLMRMGFEILRIERDIKAREYRLRLKGILTLDVVIAERSVTYTLSGGKKNDTVTNTYPISQYQETFPQKYMWRNGLFKKYKIKIGSTDKYFELGSLISAIPPNLSFVISAKHSEFTIRFPQYRESLVYSMDFLYIDGYMEAQPTRALVYKGQEHRGTDLAMFNLYRSIIGSLGN